MKKSLLILALFVSANMLGQEISGGNAGSGDPTLLTDSSVAYPLIRTS